MDNQIQEKPTKDIENNKMPWVCDWLKMTQKQVLDKFQGIVGSFSDGENQKRFVYVAGKRKDKVLLVAHADTVWGFLENGDDSKIKLKFDKGIISTGGQDIDWRKRYGNNSPWISKKGIGIGADDRAGCAILWALRNSGHSLLITSGEEIGCKSTKWIMDSKYWKNELNDEHQFAIQFDRKNAKDLIFYDIATEKFVEYVKNTTGYIVENSYGGTDIKHICKNICGVNMSVGYYDEHTVDEKLNYSEFCNTLDTVKKWLSQENLPKFEFKWVDRYVHNSFSSNCTDMTNNYYDDINMFNEENIIQDLNMKLKDNMIICYKCNEEISQDAWLRNIFVCPKCKQVI